MAAEGSTIVLIEDDPDDAEMTMLALRRLNLSDVLHIDDGAAALDFLFAGASERPLLVLLDLKMPKVDGIEILSRMKADTEKRSIPVITLISSDDGRRYVESNRVRPDGYLLKPVSARAFVEVLSEIGLSDICSFGVLPR